MTDKPIYARALPEAVRITETFKYRQEVSRNSSYEKVDEPQGQLMVSVAYDGHNSFTSRASEDVRRQAGRTRKEKQRIDALIGHLAFSNYHRTHLAEVLDLRGQLNTIPISVPVESDVLSHRQQLTDDRHAWVSKVTYEIQEPRGWPISVDFMVHDEEILAESSRSSMSKGESTSVDDIVRTVTQHLTARQDLSLLLLVRLDLPASSVVDGMAPVVRRVSVGWPRITSTRAFNLAVGDPPSEVGLFRFNPLSKGLEWRDVPMSLASTPSGAGLRTYVSPSMVLTIEQPGELYPESHAAQPGDESATVEGETLEGEVEVEIPGWLLSGLDVRLYDGIGHLVENPPLTQMTCFNVHYRLILDDIFSRRILSPRQHLYFDQVIPHDMRVLDVLTALADRGFRIVDKTPLVRGEDTFVHYIRAKRPRGPDTMWLWLVMEGKRSTTRRETQIPGGQRYTSIFESGELIVHMVGQLPGKSRVLTEEMNALQQALRERFDRLRSRR